MKTVSRRSFFGCTTAAMAGALLVLAAAPSLAGETFEAALADIQHRWAEANYHEHGKEQKRAFDNLLDDARDLASRNPERAEPLIWQGIVASSFAGVKGPFGAMGLAKEARDALEAAEAIDPTALDGSVYTSLGALYYKVPGGIIGFGDDDLARRYLLKALEVNPDGIDPNYFYGEFLYEQKEYAQARQALLRAQHAEPRAGRETADAGRQTEISTLLEKVDRKLGSKG
ncbi:MAG TPA: hypothetical protein VF200_02780 [Woeseiaceae bacterium]